MSDHADMSEIRNALEAVGAKLEKNSQTLGWILVLSAVSVAVSVLGLIMK